ncbi:MAG: hypothetical protein HY926_12855 [Elusimicrobia bacterium]|nr:hypothetical protein [Elusimicrobiota bacterium]
MRALICALLALLAAPAATQVVERETFAVIGWNDACSVAVQQFGYAPIGEAVVGEPVRTRIGTITIAPGEESSRTVLTADWSGARTWDRAEAKKVVQDLLAAGYANPGYTEDIRVPRKEGPRPYEDVILSTAALQIRAPFKWPGDDWGWDKIVYSPLGTCGLFIYSRRQKGLPFYRTALYRFYNPSARTQRAAAHQTNSRLLFEASDLEGARAEAATAARLQPELAIARYRHAVLLCLSGHLNESVAELAEAIKRDPKLAAKARHDPDFYEVYGFPLFRAAVGEDPHPVRLHREGDQP